jgi:hypothetical protein
MAALSGSELAWGAVLAVWLLSMGGGAWLGSRRGGQLVGLAGPLACATLCGAAVLLVRAAPRLLGLTLGEVLTTWRGVALLVVAVLPVAFVGGMTFPVAAASLPRRGAAAEAYAVESLGAMAGGLAFSFALAPLGSGGCVVAIAAVAVAALLVVRSPWLALVPVVAAVVLVGPAERLLAKLSWRWSERPGTLVAEVETRQERLEVGSGDAGGVWADGRLIRPMGMDGLPSGRIALALLAIPRADRVAVAASPWDERLKAVARVSGHPPALLLEDAGVLRAAAVVGDGGRDVLSGVRPLVGEPLRTIERGAPWDAIVLLDGDPATLRRDRTRTVEFFRACAGALSDRGAVIVAVGVADTYLGGVGGRLLAVLRATLSEVFPKVVAIPGDPVLLVGARDADTLTLEPGAIRRRWGDRPVDPTVFDPALLPMLLDQPRADTLREFLVQRREAPNTTRRPRAVLLAAALHEARGNPPLLAATRELLDAGPQWLIPVLIAAVAGLLARSSRGARLGPELAGVVGLSSMAWWLLLLAAWQSTLGSVYAEIGGLSAAFMAGLVGGAMVARRRGWDGDRVLAASLLGGAGLSLTVASGLPLLAPRSAIVPLLVVAGVLTGASFPALATRAGAGDSRRGAGRGFAADEIGAAVAALVVGLVLLPWAGFAATALSIAVVDGGAVLALTLANRRLSG